MERETEFREPRSQTGVWERGQTRNEANEVTCHLQNRSLLHHRSGVFSAPLTRQSPCRRSTRSGEVPTLDVSPRSIQLHPTLLETRRGMQRTEPVTCQSHREDDIQLCRLPTKSRSIAADWKKHRICPGTVRGQHPEQQHRAGDAQPLLASILRNPCEHSHSSYWTRRVVTWSPDIRRPRHNTGFGYGGSLGTEVIAGVREIKM